MKTKILVSLLVVMPLLLNLGVAATVSASSINNTPYTYNFYSESLETRLGTLVASGTILQAQAAKILDIYYIDEITTKQDMKNELDVLVAAKTITQNQEYSILNLFIDLSSNYEIPTSSNELSYTNISIDR